MVDVSGTASSACYSVTARPNCSLSPTDTACVFCIIAFISLIISLSILLVGAWPVLAFAMVELLALGYCFHYVLRHSGEFERLTMDKDKIIIEIHELQRDKRVELNRYWARLLIDCKMPDGDCRRLALRSHGREVEFGRHMTSEERLQLVAYLKPRLAGIVS